MQGSSELCPMRDELRSHVDRHVVSFLFSRLGRWKYGDRVGPGESEALACVVLGVTVLIRARQEPQEKQLCRAVCS